VKDLGAESSVCEQASVWNTLYTCSEETKPHKDLENNRR